MRRAALLMTSVWLLASQATAGTPTSGEPESVTKTLEIATAYYDAFQGRGDFAGVPMASDLRFASPRFQLHTADAFRGALSQLRPRVKSLKIRSQLHEGDVVVTIYDLDLGAPAGPIPMAERLRVEGGRLVEVDLIFDSARLPSPGEAEAPRPE